MTTYEEKARQAIPAEVHMISGSQDSQTSSDVFNVGAFALPDPAGKSGGACTSALLKVLYGQKQPSTWVSVLQQMRQVLKGMAYDQIPQLTSSRLVDVEKPMYIVPPESKGMKRAVLIGINYAGQDGALSGCHNDVANMKKYLEQVQGFRNPVVLMDDGKHTEPTKKNILDAFQRVAEQSKSGDVVFIHYSGHGGRLRDQDARTRSGFTRMRPHQGGGRDEEDGYDETLVPLDFRTSGQIRDDDLLRVLVSPMAAGVTMTCLMDSCHSGTVLDLPYRFTATGHKMYRNEKYTNKRERLRATAFPWLNVLNLFAFIANVVVTYGIGALGLFGTATNGELSEKYQTLITPVGWAFAIWALIFISQSIWAIAQLVVPSFRVAALVHHGVRCYYIGVCFAQIGWTVAFSFEIIWLSLAAMLSILFFLILIVVAQYFAQTTVSLVEYWLLKFPFAVHAGWILAASFVNLSVLIVDLELGVDAQYYAALASLIAVLLIASLVLARPTRPELAIPLVLAWATFGIYMELGNPKDSIETTFDRNTILMVRYGSIAVCVYILVSTTIAAILACRRRQPRDVDDGGYRNMSEV